MGLVKKYMFGPERDAVTGVEKRRNEEFYGL
jgi:hypothetical protein